MSSRLLATRHLLLPVVRSGILLNQVPTRLQHGTWDRMIPYYVPIKKPPPEPPAGNINRIKDHHPLDPFTTEVDPEFLDSVAPEPPIGFNMAAYVDRSPSLQELVKLGVDLSVVEKDTEIAEYLLRLDFERDMKQHIQALLDIGIPIEKLGHVITENPLIFQTSVPTIHNRVNYLRSKKFPRSCIVRIIVGYPQYLNCTIKEVDARLGYVQEEFHLDPNQLRTVLINHPQLMALETEEIRAQKMVIFDLMGFEMNWTRRLVCELPAILSEKPKKILNIFDILHNTGEIKHGLMVRFPEVFMADQRQIQDRVEYLKVLGKDQYDPNQPLYIPLSALSTVSDEVFATKYARTSEADYDLFLKKR